MTQIVDLVTLNCGIWSSVLGLLAFFFLVFSIRRVTPGYFRTLLVELCIFIFLIDVTLILKLIVYAYALFRIEYVVILLQLISFIFFLGLAISCIKYGKAFGFGKREYLKRIMAEQIYKRELKKLGLKEGKKLTGKELLELGVIRNGKLAISETRLLKKGYAKYSPERKIVEEWFERF